MATERRQPLCAIGLTLAAALVWLCGCSNRPPLAPVLGEAYVGPSELKIRGDLPLNSPTVATVRHGERLEIVQQRRGVFLRVRTPSGAEGWTDARQLLGARDMAALRDLAAQTQRMTPQGVASTYAELRVHTEPAADAPSYLMLKEGEKFDVLASEVVARDSAPRPPLVPPPPKKTKAKAKKTSRAEKTVPPPPMPKPPGPPPNWLELSGYNADEKGEEPPAGEEQTDKPVATDNWSLIRTKDGQSGWVLTRRIYMAIPDEVAQYAEGHRIVSYFPLGEVRDGDQSRQQWLWTTIAGPAGAYDFDSFRVFVWSIKRHRYETAYIERNIQGHSPVLLGQVTLAGPRGAQGAGATYPGFSVCVQKADGSRRMRDYAFLNPSVRFAGERDCPAPVSLTSGAQTFAAPALPQAAPGAGSGGPAKSTSWFARLKAKVRGLFGK